ncbi:PLP-dependent aminotransferase family protein [Actinotalea ferrariae]|uniref:MocR-like transcription factor YczR n=1 Tax=Actinotalea ferrariae TaxID=1386098 RepID=UPI001C8B10CB|nr:PLP-dependent aminotransferase family protein [Actinotalea ferrariae]MBX9246910.1 PLP-dependent aminotransferase family protein [Actinotalea ferrariae]
MPPDHPRAVERRVSAAALQRTLGAMPAGGTAYLALADGLRRAVLDGSLPLATRLPSERELAEALGVSRTTTAAAYQRLREQGFLTTRRGSGSVTTLPSEPGRAGRARDGLPLTGTDDGATVDLAVAAPTAPPQLAEAAARALEALPRLLATTGYSHQGLPGLRAQVAARYAARGTPTAPDEVLVTTGAQQAITLVISMVVGPGDRVVVEQPTYPNVLAAIRAAGGRPVPVPVGPHGLDLDLLESTVRQVAPRLVHLTPDHHNPTGQSLDDEGRARVRELAARHRTLVMADETLTDLVLDGPPPSSITGDATRSGLVAVGSASKSFWGGLRVGWVRGHRDVVGRLATRRAHHDMSTAVLEQLVVEELLARADEVLDVRRAQLRVQRDTLLAAVARHLPWQVPVPAGGLSTWVDLGAPVSSALAAVAVRHGVRVAPGPLFGADGSFEDRLRLPFSLPAEDLERGVLGLAAAWRSLGMGRDARVAAPSTVSSAASPVV